MDLSEWVKTARKHKKLTQTQLGEHLHVTKGNVSAWENGHHEPSFGQLTAISEFTGYPLMKHDPVRSEHAGTVLPLRDHEDALIIAWRVLPVGVREELLTTIENLVLTTQNATSAALGNLKLLRRADDEAVIKALGNVPKEDLRDSAARIEDKTTTGKARSSKKVTR